MNDNNKLIIFIKKYCYVVAPVLLTLFFIILDCFNIPTFLNNSILKNMEENVTTLIGISGTLIGFLFTAMTILLSLNKDSKYMQNFKRYGHNIIFCRLNILGILFLFFNIIAWLLSMNIKITILFFILGFVETIMASYYTYKLSLNSFQ